MIITLLITASYLKVFYLIILYITINFIYWETLHESKEVKMQNNTPRITSLKFVVGKDNCEAFIHWQHTIYNLWTRNIKSSLFAQK
jgi:hypothetical protein